MISIIIFLISIMSFSCFAAFCLKKDFGKTISVYSMGIVLFLFLAGLLNWLAAGVVAVLVISAGLYIATPIVVWTKKLSYSEGLKHFFTDSFVVFILSCAFFIYVNYGRFAMWDDEFSHWMDIVKIMTRIDYFGTAKGSGALFASYPPAMALFQYYLQKIQYFFGNAEFSEWKAYFSYQLLGTIVMLPLINNSNFNLLKLLHSIITYCGCLILPLFLFERAYTSIYIDPFLGIVSAAGIAVVILWKEKDWLYVVYEAMLCCTLVLSKDVGLYLVIFVIVIFMVEYYSKDGKVICAQNTLIRIIGGLLPLIFAVVPKLLWKMEVSNSDIIVKFTAPINFKGVIAVLNGTDQTYYTTVFESFKNAITYRYIYFERAGVNYVGAIALVSGAVFYFLVKLKRQGTVDRWYTVVIVGLLCSIAIVAYALSLFPLYISKFSEEEAVCVASFDRYISIPLLMGLMLIWFMARQVLENLSERTKWAVVISVLVVALFIHAKRYQVNDLLQHLSVEESARNRARFDAISEEIRSTCEDNSYITVLIQTSDSLVAASLQFIVKPHVVDDFYVTGLEMTPEELIAELSNKSDYIVTYDIDSTFVENYKSIFDDNAKIGNNHIYKINENKLMQVY